MKIDSHNGLLVKTFFNKLCPGVSYLIWQNPSLSYKYIFIYNVYRRDYSHNIILYMICKDIYISVKCINLIIFMLNQEKIYSTSQKNNFISEMYSSKKQELSFLL